MANTEKQPEGHHPPGTQQAQNWAQGPGGTQQEYTPPEPKRREDKASGPQERDPQHQPGFEAQQQKKQGKDKPQQGMQEGEYKDPFLERLSDPQHQPGFEAQQQKKQGKDENEQDRNTRVKQGGRSQADDTDATIKARDDLKAQHDQKDQRARTAARKYEVKRAKVKARKPVRKHK